VQKHPKRAASINAAGDTITKRSKKMEKISFLKRDQVLRPFSRKSTSKSDDGHRSSTGDEPLGPEQGEKILAGKGEADGSG
jgi:hypothetical protein